MNKTIEITADGGHTWLAVSCSSFSRGFSGGEWVMLEFATDQDLSQFFERQVVVRSEELQPDLFDGGFSRWRKGTYRVKR